MVLPEGQPLGAVDQFKADQSIGQFWRTVNEVYSALSTVHEYQLLIDSKQATVDDKYQAELQSLVEQYAQWQALVAKFSAFSESVNLEGAYQAVEEFKKTVNFQSAIFQEEAVKRLQQSDQGDQ